MIILGILATFYSLYLAAIPVVFAFGTFIVLAARQGVGSASLYLKRCGVAGIPLLAAFILLVFSLFFNPYGLPLWPDQDETPDQAAARRAATAFAERVGVVSGVLSVGGLFWFSRAVVVSINRPRPEDLR